MSIEGYRGTTYSPAGDLPIDLQNRRSPLRLLLLVLTVVLAAVGGGLLGGMQPLLGALLVLAAILAPALIMQSETATLTVIFILYSNVAVVANKFHGVPYFVAASFPFLLFIPLANYLVLQRKPVILHQSLPFLFAFLGVQCLGAVFSEDTQVSFSAVIDFIVEGLVIYLLITNVVRTPRTLRRVTWILLLAGVLLAGIPIFQQLTGTYANDYWGYAQLSEEGFRTGEVSLFGDVRQFKAAGAIGEQNRYAQVMLMLVPLGLFTFWAERKGGLRILALAATMLTLVAVAISFSRGAAIALFLLLVAMVIMRVIRVSRFLLFLAAVILVVVALPEYQTRIASLTDVTALVSPESRPAEVDGSIEGRATEMLAAALVFADYPVIGVGPAMFKFYSQDYGNQLGIHTLEGNREAHSLPLDIAANHGVLGLLTFFGVFAVVINQLMKARRRWEEKDPYMAKMASGYLLALVAYLTTGLFLHLAYARYLWLILALASSAGHIALYWDPRRGRLLQEQENGTQVKSY